MNILIAGGTGFIGSALTKNFRDQGHHVFHLSRKKKDQHAWLDLENNKIDFNHTPAPEIVINLTGENIGDRRWTPKQKAEIINSRVNTTNLLVEALNRAEQKPQLLISGSAIGFYGDRGNELLQETSPPGNEFSSDICIQWEQASQNIDPAVRLVNIRTGIVLGKHGGSLKKMLLPFKFGLGGVIGPGTQYFSWISLTDLVRAIDFIIENENINGPVNLVAPNPITNRAFTGSLASALHRPALLPMPAWLVKILFGEMGETLLLGSSRVVPEVLNDKGFSFSYPSIEDAFDHIFRPR